MQAICNNTRSICRVVPLPYQRNFDADARDFESRALQAALSPYEISTYPATVGQYSKFVEDGGYQETVIGRQADLGGIQYRIIWRNRIIADVFPSIFACFIDDSWLQ